MVGDVYIASCFSCFVFIFLLWKRIVGFSMGALAPFDVLRLGRWLSSPFGTLEISILLGFRDDFEIECLIGDISRVELADLQFWDEYVTRFSMM